MTPLASIQPILSVEKHPNADALDIVGILGYKAIVKRGAWVVGDLCIYVQPDSVLPDVPWAAFYKAKSSRIKAIRLRNIWSDGVVESAVNVGYTGPMEPGLDVTEILGVTKYVVPEPQDLNASGPYGFGIPKTDEERFESIDPSQLPPWGTLVDVTTKYDGQSISFFWCMKDGVIHTGIGGRTFLYKQECSNNYTRNEAQHKVIDKLGYFCVEYGCVGLCLRGESYGNGIQKKNHNPHSKLPLGLALYSTWLIDERRYARKGEPFYIHNIAKELNLPTVPILERDVPLTTELIVKYSEGLEKLPNGSPFEGVVIQHAGGSFKVINRWYDSK